MNGSVGSRVRRSIVVAVGAALAVLAPGAATTALADPVKGALTYELQDLKVRLRGRVRRDPGGGGH